MFQVRGLKRGNHSKAGGQDVDPADLEKAESLQSGQNVGIKEWTELGREALAIWWSCHSLHCT